MTENELGLVCHQCGKWFAVEGARRPAEILSDEGVEIESGPAMTLTCLRCGTKGLYSQLELNPRPDGGPPDRA